MIVDLAAVPETLGESELGHEKGAFTGADRQKAGCELAHTGTLFIDEIKMSLAQVKPCGCPERYSRVGNASTAFPGLGGCHQPGPGRRAAGRFRQDLYYRLNVVPLVMPP